MNRRTLLISAPAALLGGCASTADRRTLEQQVTARDHAAFASFLAEDAVFLNGGHGELRGREAIAAYWKRFYNAPQAPFSWKPDRVAVLDSGVLAYSTGPVARPDGKAFARYYSTWRLEPAGGWRIIFDDGCNLGECA